VLLTILAGSSIDSPANTEPIEISDNIWPSSSLMYRVYSQKLATISTFETEKHFGSISIVPSTWATYWEVILILISLYDFGSSMIFLGSIVNSQFPETDGFSSMVVRVSDLLAIFQVTSLVVPILMKPKLMNGSN
jgi:hypothetical protein